MKITTNGCQAAKDALTDDRFLACGIATVHSAGDEWSADSLTITEHGLQDLPYVVRSGETFNVMQAESAPGVLAFQPQTATNVMIPLSAEFLDSYKEFWEISQLNPTGPKVGVDILVWYPEGSRKLVEVE